MAFQGQGGESVAVIIRGRTPAHQWQGSWFGWGKDAGYGRSSRQGGHTEDEGAGCWLFLGEKFGYLR